MAPVAVKGLDMLTDFYYIHLGVFKFYILVEYIWKRQIKQ